MIDDLNPKPWMKHVLLAAGNYNLLWGALAIVMPGVSLAWTGLEPTLNYPSIWQGMGMVIGVYGIGYLIAATNPFRYWPIVLVGLLGKVLGPIGVAWNVWRGELPVSMFRMILFNDLIWWLPFTLILWHSFRHAQAVGTIHLLDEYDDPIRDLKTNTGQSLWDLSFEKRLLVVFLRHTGCTFCREALADLQEQRSEIEATGCQIVLIHLGSDRNAEKMFAKYGLQDVPRICDPECRLYRQFGLKHGEFTQLFGLKVFLRGMFAALISGHGFGALQGNGFQMPGAFVFEEGKFLRGFEHTCAADRINFVSFVTELETTAPPQQLAGVS